MIIADLPTDCPDPIERVARCRKAMSAAKRQFKLVPAEALVDVAQFSSPVLATAAVRLASQLRLADRVNPPVNLVISNVPGPRQPLYFAGAKMMHQFPVSIVTDGQGLNITMHSCLDRLDFGFIVDRELVPDVWDLADVHIDEIARLFEATGAEWAQRPNPPFPPRADQVGPGRDAEEIGGQEVGAQEVAGEEAVTPTDGSGLVLRSLGAT